MRIRKTISSVDMAILLLSQLPSRYGAFYSSLITFGRMTNATWEELVPMVLDQEDRFKVSTPKADFAALTGQASKKTNKKKGQSKDDSSDKSTKKKTQKERVCYKCGDPGHVRKDCPKKKDKDSDKDDAKEKDHSASSHIAQVSAYVHIEQLDAEDTIPGEIGLATSVDVEWIIDSGATRHMTSRK